MKNKILAALFFVIFFSARLAYASPPVVYISQIQITGGAGKTEQDFVELFNPNSTAVDLKGYRLVKRNAAATADTLIKSWDKDVNIPPQSFYLWANSGYSSITVRPDTATTADLSADSGVALRFGASNTGQIVDSAAWGKSNNGFSNISPANPAANQALVRKDLFAAVSDFYIGVATPRNSTMAAQSAPAPLPSAAPPIKAAAVSSSAGQKSTSLAVSNTQGQVEGASTTAPELSGNSALTDRAGIEQPANNLYTGPDTAPPSAKNYLILAGAAALALGFLAYKFFIKKQA